MCQVYNPVAKNKQGTNVHDAVKDKQRGFLHSAATNVMGGRPALRIRKQISAAQTAEQRLKNPLWIAALAVRSCEVSLKLNSNS
jgi:hypothetical protein